MQNMIRDWLQSTLHKVPWCPGIPAAGPVINPVGFWLLKDFFLRTFSWKAYFSRRKIQIHEDICSNGW